MNELEKLLLEAREQLQNDLQTQLEGLVKDHVIEAACQDVVERLQPLLDRIKKD